MEKAFWHEIWAQETQGFHEGKPNHFLTQHIARFQDAHRILVPLCGRSHDLCYLAECGHDVTGVELVEDAARGFFEEQNLSVTERTHQGNLLLESGTIRIFVADILDLRPETFGAFDAIYDRAAAVALPEDIRLRYARTMDAVLAPEGAIFLVTFVDPERTTGPPFAIDQRGVERMYPTRSIEVIDRLDPARDAELPPNAMVQKVFWIR